MRRSVAAFAFTSTCALLSASCGGAAKSTQRAAGGRVPVTVLLTGDGDGGVRSALEGAGDLPVELRFAPLPKRGQSEGDREAGAKIPQKVAKARQLYVNARFAACAETLQANATELLGAGERALAARVLFWRIACRVGAGETREARREARAFAILGLQIPSDVDSVTPDVERLLLEAERAAAKAPRITARITAAVVRPLGDKARGQVKPADRPDVMHRNIRRGSEAERSGPAFGLSDRPEAINGRVAVDGRARDCITPCGVELPAGDHVIRVDADGVVPAVQVVRVDAENAEFQLTTAPASPQLAAKQWTMRYATSPAIDTVPSMRLLARSIRSRNLALLEVARGKKRVHLRGALAVDGDVFARAERSGVNTGDVAGQAPSLLGELLVRGEVLAPPPPLYRRRGFWLAVGAAALATAAVTGAILYQPGKRQEISF